MTITSTGLDKGTLSPDQFVKVDARGAVTGGPGKPSAETALHVVIACSLQAGVVVHTHSIWSTTLSDPHRTP